LFQSVVLRGGQDGQQAGLESWFYHIGARCWRPSRRQIGTEAGVDLESVVARKPWCAVARNADLASLARLASTLFGLQTDAKRDTRAAMAGITPLALLVALVLILVVPEFCAALGDDCLAVAALGVV